MNIKKYLFDKKHRNSIRKSLNIDNKIVIGHVGRLSKEKNHLFMIELIKKLPSDYVLVCVGNGPDEGKIKHKIIEEGLTDRIILVGKSINANYYYSAFDLFILPSLYEGLPTVAIEAQVSGLRCILSSNITKEVNVDNDVVFLELDQDRWAKEIIISEFHRKTIDTLRFKEYDIRYEVRELENIYDELLG